MHLIMNNLANARVASLHFYTMSKVRKLQKKTSSVHSITYILVIKIGWAVFEKIRFFDFSKFVHNFCKNFFFVLILRTNSSYNGSHLPSQYESKPSGGTQTMLILLRPSGDIFQRDGTLHVFFEITLKFVAKSSGMKTTPRNSE